MYQENKCKEYIGTHDEVLCGFYGVNDTLELIYGISSIQGFLREASTSRPGVGYSRFRRKAASTMRKVVCIIVDDSSLFCR